jgi:hypothetical protein
MRRGPQPQSVSNEAPVNAAQVRVLYHGDANTDPDPHGELKLLRIMDHLVDEGAEQNVAL